MKIISVHVEGSYGGKWRSFLNQTLTITESTQNELYHPKKRVHGDYFTDILSYKYYRKDTIIMTETCDFNNNPDNKISIELISNYKDRIDHKEEIKKLSNIDENFVKYLKSSSHSKCTYRAEIYNLIYYALNRTENIICRRYFYHPRRYSSRFDIWISGNDKPTQNNEVGIISFDIIQIIIHPETLKVDKFVKQIQICDLNDFGDKITSHFNFDSCYFERLVDDTHEDDKEYLKWSKTNEIAFTKNSSIKSHAAYKIAKWIKIVSTEIARNKLPDNLYKLFASHIGIYLNIGLTKIIVDYLL